MEDETKSKLNPPTDHRLLTAPEVKLHGAIKVTGVFRASTEKSPAVLCTLALFHEVTLVAVPAEAVSRVTPTSKGDGTADWISDGDAVDRKSEQHSRGDFKE